MAEATVTVKLNPVEFDLVREAIKGEYEVAKQTVADASEPQSVRAKARSRQVQLQDLGAKLGV